PAVGVHVEGVEHVPVADADELDGLTEVGFEHRGVRGDLVVDQHAVEHDGELTVGKDVARAAHDEPSIQPGGNSTGSVRGTHGVIVVVPVAGAAGPGPPAQDRKSTRLNSSHVSISYAV